jgi:aminobenzoyl-glutamate transport protein
MNADGLRRIVENLVSNFVNFVPLGTVLVALLGVGVAEASGLLSAGIRALVLKAPAISSSRSPSSSPACSPTRLRDGLRDPRAARGRHLPGARPAPARRHGRGVRGVSGGYSANLLIGTVDPLLAGITQEAAQLIDPGYTVHPLVNWYFMIVSTFLVTGVGTWVTVKIVEPKLGGLRCEPRRGGRGRQPHAGAALRRGSEAGLLAAAARAAVVIAG